MKRILLFIVSAVSICLPQDLFGQGMFVSNLGQTPVGSAPIGSDTWIAQTFLTGTNAAGYVLHSIQLLMNPATGSPNGFSLSVCDKTGDPHIFRTGDLPQNSLGSLAGVDPAAGGLFAYSTSNLELSPRTWYFVVATSASPVSQGAYNWSAASGVTGTQGPSDPWVLSNSYLSSANGSTWTETIRQYVFQLAINGTPVPEPSACGLCAAALACSGLWRRLHRPGERRPDK